MVAVPFAYRRAESFEEAVSLLAEHGEDAKLLAGGQSLVAMMNLRLARPTLLVDLNPIGSPPPSVVGGQVRIPALTRHKTLADPRASFGAPLLSVAARHVGNVRVRARGTIGGSLAHADPTAELAAACLALGGTVSVLGPGGTRELLVDELLVPYSTTALEPDEVITGVTVPVHVAGRTGFGFHEMVRRSSDLAIVAVAAHVELAEAGGTIATARVAVAGVGERVVLAPAELTEGLRGMPAGEADAEGLGRALAAGLRPSGDVHASGEYRRRLVSVLTRRALGDALGRTPTREVAA